MTYAVVATTVFTRTEQEVEDRFWSWIEHIPVRGWRKKTILKNKKIVMDTLSIFHQDYLSIFFRKIKDRIVSQEYADRDICALAYDTDEDLHKNEYGELSIPTNLYNEIKLHLRELENRKIIHSSYFKTSSWNWHSQCSRDISRLEIPYKTTKTIEEFPTKSASE